MVTDFKGDKVVLLPAHGKTQGAFRAVPVRDAAGVLLGAPDYTDPKNEPTFKMKGRVELDLSKPIHASIWSWLKHIPEVVGSYPEARSDGKALYYVQDDDRDAQIMVKRVSSKREAMNIVHDLTLAGQEELAKLLGSNPSNFTKTELLSYLLQIADDKPERIVNAFNDPHKKEKLFLDEAISKKIITYNAVLRTFNYGDQFLGTTKDHAIAWLANPTNREYTRGIIINVKQLVGEAKTGSFLDDFTMDTGEKVTSGSVIDEEKLKLEKEKLEKDPVI